MLRGLLLFRHKLHVTPLLQKSEILHEIKARWASLQPGEANHLCQRPMTVAPVKCLYLGVSPRAVGLAFALVRRYLIERERTKAFALHDQVTRFFKLRI